MKKHLSTLLPILVIAVMGAIFHWEYLNTYPSNTHAWAQADRFAITKGFVRNDLNFFEPETYILNPQFPGNWSKPQEKSITSVDFPIHDYIPALIMKISGNEQPWISRLYNLLYSFIGLFALFKMSTLFIRNTAFSFLIVVIAATSPVFVFYQASFIPTIPSLANAILAIYLYFLYLKFGEIKHFGWSILLITLAALSRTTFVIPLIAILCHFILLLFKKRERLLSKTLLFVLSFSSILGYFLYNSYLKEKYGSLFLGNITPPENFSAFIIEISESWKNWGMDYFLLNHYLIFALTLLLDLLFFIKKRNFKLSELAKFTIILWIGNLLYLVAMSYQFMNHDYYFLDSLYLPIILSLILLLRQIPSYHKKSKRMILNGLVAFSSITLFLSAETKQTERHTYKFWDSLPNTYNNYRNGEDILEKLGASEDAKILLIEPIAPNYCLSLFNRKGYCTMAPWKERVEPALEWDVDYVIFQNEYFLTDIYPKYPDIIHRLKKKYDNGSISICKIERNSQTLEEFLGISFIEPEIKQVLNFETDSLLPLWKNINRNNAKSNLGVFSTEVNSSMEYGPAYSDTNFDFSRREVVIMGNGFLYPEQMKGGSLIVSVNKNGRDLYYKEIALSKITTTKKEWQSFYFQFYIQHLDRRSCEIKFFFYNPNGSIYYLDDFNLRIYRDFGYLVKK